MNVVQRRLEFFGFFTRSIRGPWRSPSGGIIRRLHYVQNKTIYFLYYSIPSAANRALLSASAILAEKLQPQLKQPND